MTDTSLEAILSPDRGEPAAPAAGTPEPALVAEPSPAPAPDPPPQGGEPAPQALQDGSAPPLAPSAPPPGFVPQAAVAEARGKEREARERAALLERQVQALLERLPAPPKAEPPPAPDWWVEPDNALAHGVRQHVDPLVQRFEQMAHYNAQLVAGQLYGQETVSAAEKAFEAAMKAGQISEPEARQVLSAPNIFEAAVKWHRRTTALARFGEDPDAFEAQLREKILTEIRASGQVPPAAAPNGAAGAPVLPSNIADARSAGSRSGPAWSGPVPMGDIFKR